MLPTLFNTPPKPEADRARRHENASRMIADVMRNRHRYV